MTSVGHAPKVVFVNRYFDPDQSATSQLLTDLARGLAARGFEVHVVCSRQMYDDPTARLVARETLFGVSVHRIATTRFGRGHLPGRAMDYLSFYASCAACLLRLLQRGDVLVAKTDPPLLSLVAAPIANAKGVALINWQQDVFPEIASQLGANPLPRFLDGLLQRLRDTSLRHATMNIVLGGRMREHFLNRGIPEGKLRVFENWADGDAIQPKPTFASKLRQERGLLEKFVVCYSGNLGRAHEFDTFLGAAQMLNDDSKFAFLIIGNGAKLEVLKQAVATRGLNNFLFLAYQPRDALADSLAAADVHLVSLVPALEGLIVPSKLYGILAAGRPLVFIGDRDSDVARLIQRAAVGVRVDVGDSVGLTDALRCLEKEYETRISMGERARNIFCAEFTLQHSIDRWASLVEAAFAERAAEFTKGSDLKAEKP
jgi:glycosyltransferase involved in cell wall biosynthesis